MDRHATGRHDGGEAGLSSSDGPLWSTYGGKVGRSVATACLLRVRSRLCHQRLLICGQPNKPREFVPGQRCDRTPRRHRSVVIIANTLFHYYFCAAPTLIVAFVSFLIMMAGCSEQPTSFITSPLPAGLSMSSSTGTISGTPTQLSAAARYSVTPINSSGLGATIYMYVGVYDFDSVTGTDKAALIDFMKAMAFGGWGSQWSGTSCKNGWGAGNSCSWTGIQCNAGGRVTSIQLPQCTVS